jgi:proteasome activator subunit 4
MILSNRFDPQNQSSFAEAKKLLFMHTLFAIFSWHLEPAGTQPLADILLSLNHPYKQVREMMGGVLNEVFQQRWKPGFASPENVLLKYREESTKVGYPPTELDEMDKERFGGILECLQKWKVEQNEMTPVPIGPTNYRDGSKTG